MNKVKVGVIGCGYWGPNLIRNFIELPGSTVKVVCDLREERLNHVKNCYPQVHTTQSLDEFFSMDLDAAVVATPPATHYDIATQCLRNGLNVLVEKPLALNSVHAQAMTDLAKEVSKILMVGHTFIYNPAVQYLRKLIQDGELGHIYYVDTVRVNLGLFQPSLNTLWDLAPHDISILSYILDSLPQTVVAQGTSCVFEGVHDIVYMNIVYPGNVLAHVHVSWLDPCKVRRITVVGSKKMVVYDDIEPTEKIKIFDKSIEAPPYTDSFHDFKCFYHYGDVVIPNIPGTEPLKLECGHFIDCIVKGEQPKSDGAAGVEVIRILEAAQKSLTNGWGKEKIEW